MNKQSYLLILLTWFFGNISVYFISPILPQLATDLASTTRWAQLTISFFLLGKALSMLIWAKASEFWGRKPIFIGGILLYTLTNWLAAASSSIYILIVMRLLQGVSVGATLLMGRAMINDTQNEQQATRQFAYLFSLAGLVICFLPMIASYLNARVSWQIIFFIIGGYSFLLLFFCPKITETNHSYQNIGLLNSAALIFKNALFVHYLLISALMMAGESLFNTSASFILIKGAGYSLANYGLMKTAIAIMHVLGTLVCGLLVRYFSSTVLLSAGIRFFALAACCMWLFDWSHQSLNFTFIAPMMIYYFGTGFIVATTTAASVRPFPKQMTTALGFSLFFQFIMSALFSFISSLMSIEQVKPFMIVITLISFTSLMVLQRLRLSNTLNKPSSTLRQEVL